MRKEARKVEQKGERGEGGFLACHAKGGGGSFCCRHVTESQNAASGRLHARRRDVLGLQKVKKL